MTEIKIAAFNAWANESQNTLVGDGDPTAAQLVAQRGARVYQHQIDRYSNHPEFFVTPEEYGELYPVEGRVIVVAPVGISPPIAPLEGHPIPPDSFTGETTQHELGEGNSVVVHREPDLEEEEPQRKKKKGNH